MKSPIEVILFDLGGVIVQFRETGYFAGLLNEKNDAQAIEKWIHCPIVQAYEKGEFKRDQFAEGVVEYFQLNISPDDFLCAFLEWPQDVYTGSEELVSAINSNIRVGCLSNTSEFHWNNQKAAPIIKGMFELKFLSFELGRQKPDPTIYLEVARHLNCASSAILFFDDNLQNIESASDVGFDAHLVRGADEARIILEERDLLK